MKDTLRHIIGYSVGITTFMVLIPFGLYEISKTGCFFKTGLIDSMMFRMIVSLPIFLVGVVFIIWSNIFLFKIGKGGPVDGFYISVSPQTKKLVISGPYRYSRNPMVFGVLTLYTSIGIFLNSINCLISIFIFVFIIINYLKLYEEKRLLKDFGNEYIDYKSKVPMILPIKRIKIISWK